MTETTRTSAATGPDGIPEGLRQVGTNPLQPYPQPADWPEVKEAVIAYLTSARGTLAARSRGDDELDPTRRRVVPRIWYNDGTFHWPGAAAYYAATHDLAPHPELLAHIRANGFWLPGRS